MIKTDGRELWFKDEVFGFSVFAGVDSSVCLCPIERVAVLRV